MENNILHFIRYSRKSSEAKERQALSIQDQNTECDKIIIKEDLQVIARLDESKTSFKPHVRPQFDKMIDLIKTGKANAILTWKPDRLCRNPEEGGLLLQMLQDGAIKEMRTAAGDVYTQDSDHLILQIHFGMANQYSRNLSQNVRRGNDRKVFDRKQYYRPAPLGYEGIGLRGQRDIKPHPLEYSLIVKAFNMAKVGLYSLNEIVKELTKAGFRTKRGKKLSKSHIHQILTNPLYYGYFHYRGELCEGSYEPLISKGLFDLVQEKLNDRSRPRILNWDKEFLGLFHCGECGCAVTTSNKNKYLKKTKVNKLFVYHHCTRRRGNCKQKPVTDIEFKTMLYEKINKIVIDKEVWQLGLKLVKAKHSEEMNKIKRQYQYIAQQETSIRSQITKLIEMRSNDELTKAEFIEQKTRLTEKLANMDSRANDNSHSVKTWLELMEEYLDTAFQLLDVVKNGTFEQKQNILRRVGENFLMKDKKIVITYRKPYDILLKPTVRKDVLPEPQLLRVPPLQDYFNAFLTTLQDVRYFGEMKQRWLEIKKLQIGGVLT
jgi:DNA invertase Pin-like site-specific DNA recombinase